MTFETNGRALNYWKDNKIDNGSVAVMSDPGQSVAALWEAIDLLDGKDIPKELTFPIMLVEQKTETRGPPPSSRTSTPPGRGRRSCSASRSRRRRTGPSR